MLVTRTEMFTDWSYEGAHMGEQAATVGRGLMSGHIYFRYAYDFLDTGERVQRERSFVELSDGSTYELGSGASADKITIIDDGITSGGEVHLQVIGKPEVGVGVSRILRHVTIEYDDGKVPVLDTDQLNGILAELSDHLTDSMVDTAEAVKQELRSELSTKVADVQVNMQNVLSEELAETKTEIREDISEAKEELRRETTEAVKEVSDDLNDWVASAGQTHDDLTRKIQEVGAAPRTRMNVAMWRTPGIYTLAKGVVTNILEHQPTVFSADPCIVWDATNKALKLVNVPTDKNKVLRITVTGGLTIDTAALGNIVVALRDNRGSIISQSHMFIQRERMESLTVGAQFAIELFIGAGEATHNALTTGIRITYENRMNEGKQFVLSTDSSICITVLTQE